MNASKLLVLAALFSIYALSAETNVTIKPISQLAQNSNKEAHSTLTDQGTCTCECVCPENNGPTLIQYIGPSLHKLLDPWNLYFMAGLIVGWDLFRRAAGPAH